jgi:hypothetical protein
LSQYQNPIFFNTCKKSSAEFWESIEFDNTKSDKHVSKLILKQYTAPSYVRKAMIDSVTGSVKPYRLGFSQCKVLSPANPIKSDVTALSTDNVINSGQLSLGVVPKCIYIALKSLGPVGSDVTKPYRNSNFFGRIKKLNVSLNNTETVISHSDSALALYYMAKANNLNLSKETALLTNGYVLKLDLTKDLALSGNIIGSNTPCTLSLDITFDNLANFETKYELRLVIVNESQVVYADREFKVSEKLVLSSTPFDISSQASIWYSENTVSLQMIGGGILGDAWSQIKKLASKGWNYVKENPQDVLANIMKYGKLLAAGHPSNNTVGGNIPSINMIAGNKTLSGGQTNVQPGGSNIKSLTFKH